MMIVGAVTTFNPWGPIRLCVEKEKYYLTNNTSLNNDIKLFLISLKEEKVLAYSSSNNLKVAYMPFKVDGFYILAGL